jgi:hypothetical protein
LRRLLPLLRLRLLPLLPLLWLLLRLLLLLLLRLPFALRRRAALVLGLRIGRRAHHTGERTAAIVLSEGRSPAQERHRQGRHHCTFHFSSAFDWD